MDEGVGELIVVWTARLAVAAYVVRLWADVARGNPVCHPTTDASSSDHVSTGEDVATAIRKPGFFDARTVLWIWTLGCGIYLLHVFAAFQFVHDWSHTSAYEHTVRQTAAVTGWHWGGGLWINYVFTLWWPLDVLWCWQRAIARMPRWYVITLHAFVGFLVFNATVMFGPPWWRWASLMLVMLAAARMATRTS